MKRLWLIIILLLPAVAAVAQTLSGDITNSEGQPVSYATVYIKQLRQGTTADIKGHYSIRLAQGTYDVIYQSMGYGQVEQTITISESKINNVELPLRYYQIPEIRITVSGEDPAYSIMRKAIGMAPYYSNYISQYTAEIYLKGSFLITKMPGIVKRRINAEIKDNAEAISAIAKIDAKKTSIKEGDLFMMESFNEMKYTAPDKYEQRVISAGNSFPFEVKDLVPLDYLSINFYRPSIAQIAISPLSPQAFSHYKYRFAGATDQGDLTISKIEVIPLRKSQQLFSGYIYIVEDLWCLQSVDLTNKNLGGVITVKQLFINVQDNIWLPVNHQFEYDINLLGIWAKASYTSSIKYTDIKPNPNLKKPEGYTSTVKADTSTITEKTSANMTKIEKILGKEDISNRDMSKLSRLISKENREARPDSVKNKMEIKLGTVKTVEEDAYKKDREYWDKIRPIPLSEEEKRQMKVGLKDTVKTNYGLAETIIDTAAMTTASKKRSIATRILLGHTWNSDNGFNLKFYGLADPERTGFNTVDGFFYGLGFRAAKKFKNNSRLSLTPDVRYAFSRQAVLWMLNGNYRFNTLNNNNIYVKLGSTGNNMNTADGINPFINSLTSLFLRKNYLKLYDSRHFVLGYSGEPSNGLYVNISNRFEDRRMLENNTDFSFIPSGKRSYSANIPENYRLDDASIPLLLSNHRHYGFSTDLAFIPRQKYSFLNGKKINRGSEWPKFQLTWTHGINIFADETKHFDALRFQINKSHRHNLFNSFDWQLGTGGIINGRNASFIDFHHFNTQPFPLVINHYNNALLLRPFYSVDTPDFYIDGYAEYTASYLLVKFIPGISNTLCRENLNVAFIAVKDRPVYYELGYSISEIFLFAEIGVYAGFENLKYRSFGIRTAIRFKY